MRTKIFLILVVLFFINCKGEKLVLIGGGLADNNSDIYNVFIQYSTPPNQLPNIGIITCASGDEAETNGQYYVDLFKNTYKVKQVSWIPIDLDQLQNAYNQTIINQAQSMTGIFFGGGDQSRLLTCLFTNQNTDTPLLQAIRTNFNQNQTTIAGTSAGCTILQSSPMVTGGESYQALLNGAYSYIDDQHPDDLSYDAKGGFKFFTYGYLDTHFATRGRQGRLVRLISDLLIQYKINIGYGVDENTAFAINNGIGKVIGETGVYIINLAYAQSTNKNGKYNIQNVSISYLTQDDTFNLNTLQVSFASWKNNIIGRWQYSYPMSPTDDIFSSPDDYNSDGRKYPREFTKVSTDLFNSQKSNTTYGYTYESNPSFKVNMFKTNLSNGYIGQKGLIKKVQYISYEKMQVDIQYLTSSYNWLTWIENQFEQFLNYFI